MRLLPIFSLLLLCLFCISCGPKKPQVDPVSEEMKAAVAGSEAHAKIKGPVDWEVDPETGKYWMNVTFENVGGPGKVAVRGALKVMVPYIGIGEGPSEPQYLDMQPGDIKGLRITGKISQKIADKAIGYALEIYPAANSGQ